MNNEKNETEKIPEPDTQKITMYMRLYHEAKKKLRKRKIRIINLLNQTADELSEINTLARNVEVIGATVSFGGGVIKFLSTWLTDDAKVCCGYAEVTETGLSQCYHFYNEVEFKKYLKNQFNIICKEMLKIPDLKI